MHGPAQVEPQAGWLRRGGRLRPLGHRRHRGVAWVPFCGACGREGRWTTHVKVLPMAEAGGGSMEDVVAAAIGDLVRLGSEMVGVQYYSRGLFHDLI